jgi:hypothetical protein
MLDLETQVELDTFLQQFAEYERLSKLTPVAAVEKKAKDLRIAFIREFRKVAPDAAKIKNLPQFLHGKVKVRPKFRAEAEAANDQLAARRDQGLERKKNGEVRSIRRRVVSNYRRAVKREISARVRSINYLASTWVNPAHTVSKKPRQTNFNHRMGSGGVVSQVRINTEGDNPEVQLRNFVYAVAKIGYGRGIIANGLARTSADMQEYIQRKQGELNAAFNAQP